MNCQELHFYFEQHVGRCSDIFNSDGVRLHTAECSDCDAFVTAEKELSASLTTVRNAAGEAPEALDDTVLEGYRRHIAEARISATSTEGRRHRSIAMLRWVAAAAVILVMTTVPFFLKRRDVNPDPLDTRALVPMAPKVPLAQAESATMVAKRQQTNVRALGKGHAGGAFSVNPASIPLPGFRSLMYCDELSCQGDMEMIRVPLTASTLALSPGSTQTNDVVYADVLVGRDGIARGIRIAQ